MDDDIKQLEDKIKAAKSEQEEKNKPSADEKAGVHAGLELAGAIILPTLVGYWLDLQFETLPLFMISLFFLGTFTGFYNVYKITQNLGTSVGHSQLHPDKKPAKTTSNLEQQEKEAE